jgi:ABC-type glycerol-3-phosphate transport system substrate-binding protein
MAFYRDNDCFNLTTDNNNSGSAWDDDLQALIDGKASMVFAAGWGPGFLTANGRVPGQDFSYGNALPTSAYVFTVELVTMNAKTTHTAEAGAFVAQALSKEAQLGFAKYRGSVPAVAFTQSDITEPGVQANYRDFTAAQTGGTLGPMAAWIADANKPAQLLEQMMKNTMTVDKVVSGYLCNAPAYPGYNCPK